MTRQVERGHAPPREQRVEVPDAPAMYPDLDFTLRGAFTTPFGSDVFKHGFTTPVDDLIQRCATEQGPPPPAASHHVNPPPSQMRGATFMGSAEGFEQGPLTGVGTGEPFGPGAVGTTVRSEPTLWNPPAAAQPAGSQDQPQDPNQESHLATVDAPLEEQDGGMSDLFALMDDTLALWPSVSPIFG